MKIVKFHVMPRHASVRILTLLPKLISLLLFTCLAQVKLSQALGFDTVKTINANESYEWGYRMTKYQTERACLYSASSSFGLIRLAMQEFKIYNAVHETFSKVKRFKESRFEKL